jgi:HK97 family phage major capsid protein
MLQEKAKMADSYKPTGGMVSEAQKGLDWRSEFGRGGTEVGIARARDIVNGKNLPLDTVKRMYSFFSRHEVDKQAEGFSPGEEGYPSNGRIAWALWGGDAGFSWSRKIVNANRAYDEGRPYPNEHAARIKDPAQFDDFRREADAGGAGIDFIYGIKDGESEIQAIRFDKNRYTVEEAKAWLAEHDFTPIKFEAAMERENEDVEVLEEEAITVEEIAEIIEEASEDETVVDEREERDAPQEIVHRSMGMESKVVDEETRRVRIAVSSEKPVERSFGNEILVHDARSIDMDFLASGRAPLLLDHDPEKQIGVIESVDLDSESRRLRAVARFGKGALAQEIFSDVVDGIRTNISVGYRVNKMEKSGSDSYRVSSWSPLEVSVVSIPADSSVGLGRSATASEPQASQEPVNETRQGEITMSENIVDIEAVKAEAAKNAARNASEILSLGSRHNKRDMAEKAISEGRSVAEFRGMLLDAIGTDKPLEQTSEIGFTKEEKREYSLARAVRNMAAGKFGGFEAEVSQELAARYGKDPRGFYVPMDIFKRDVTTASPANGSNLVPTDHLGAEFIDALRANLVISGLGARMMSGLKGDVAIPAMNAKTAVGFVAENNAPAAEGAPSFRQVTMAPRTMVQYIDISRKLMMQSDPSVDAVLRNDMVQQFASKLDEVAIEGGGANEPTGILGTSGIGSVALGTNGGAITYASLVNLEREVAIDNALAGSLAYLTNPKVVAAMRQTARQTSGVEGNFILNDTNTLLGYRVASSTLVPSDLTKGTSSGVCSAVVFGNYADLMIGLFGGLDVLVDPYTGSSTGATRIAMYQDVDVAVRHAESFAAIKDVTTV